MIFVPTETNLVELWVSFQNNYFYRCACKKSQKYSGMNDKLVYHISFHLGRNDEIRKEYLRTGY